MPIFHLDSTGKERDEETGYGYFGARYMDHELMTMWLSVDPMADKYPSLSPYNYCAWNPVKLVDPDGCEIDTASVSEKIWNMVNPQHTDYNAAFAEVFNQLANDHTTLFSFEEWDEPRTKGNAQILGTFTLTESNDGCMDKTTIGFYWGGDYPQRYLYEEVYHAKQFLDGEFGFGRASISADWGLMGFDLYDEEDAHKWADNACNSPDSWTQEARNYYRIDRGLPETRRNVTEHYMQYDGIQRTTLPNYDENGVFKDVGYRTMRKPKQK